ncbi:hypothetical protein C1H46_010914 [Malus baccata]|uniref:Uncharacterized protein n=1 Tax=Malus baccata TaxID=106549 RepID=A0A540MXV5_MALBA|nr:hypothetical protein C1H46_010914 [Malus baccata]
MAITRTSSSVPAQALRYKSVTKTQTQQAYTKAHAMSLLASKTIKIITDKRDRKNHRC